MNSRIRSWNKTKLAGCGLVTVIVVVAVGLIFLRKHKAYEAGPILQDMSTDRVTIVWWQNSEETADVVLRNPAGQVSRFPAKRVGHRFEATVQGLDPSTGYDYWVESGSMIDNLVKAPARFVTAPLPGTPFSFIVFGDSGDGGNSQIRLAKVMARRPVSLVLHAGDLNYGRNEFEDFVSNFFTPYQSITRAVPLYPVLGNHDIENGRGKLFMDIFHLPLNGPPAVPPEHCYWFNYGDALFVAVDSNLDKDTLLNDVAPWLEHVLKTSSCTWKFVMFHHSPWAAGGRLANDKVNDALVPAIEAGGADMVFSGHNHLYQRTYPMLSGKHIQNSGVVYVTSGAGGKTLQTEERIYETYLAAFNDSTFSFTEVTVNGSNLELMQISDDNSILDSVSLEKPELYLDAHSH